MIMIMIMTSLRALLPLHLLWGARPSPPTECLFIINHLFLETPFLFPPRSLSLSLSLYLFKNVFFRGKGGPKDDFWQSWAAQPANDETGLSQPKLDQKGAKCMKNTCQNRLKTITNESWADFTPSKTLINTKFENLFFSG